VNRDRILASLRLVMEQERRSGIRYWCDPGLAEAITKVAKLPNGSGIVAPARTKPPVASARRAASPQDPTPPRRFARPPARLNPDAPAQARAASGSQAKPARPKWGAPPKATGRLRDWRAKLAAIEEEVKGCRLCALCEGRANTVFGIGEAEVPLVFVGEAPGAEEDRQGLPFVGRAGALLTRIIEAMGLKREQVYICNVLKCRPPGNRDPHPDEVGSCSPYLDRQLDLLNPTVICTLGRHSTIRLTGQAVAMKAIRGRVFEYRGFKVVPTYHPAALLRNPSLKALVWEDVQKVRALLDAEKGAS
jgi:DNA polymerase